MNGQIKVIAFDADDTLWVNETYFRETEAKFCDMLSDFLPPHGVERILLEVEKRNLSSLGYGVKGFIISMIETAIEVTEGNLSISDLENIIKLGKNQLEKPVLLIDGVEQVLKKLSNEYKLIVATKGDLLEQQNKIDKSGLGKYFHHIEIVSEKTVTEYSKMIKHLDIDPSNFLMIGNSLKSDVLPVLEIGGYAWHIPFSITWALEKIQGNVDHPRFRSFDKIIEILPILL